MPMDLPFVKCFAAPIIQQSEACAYIKNYFIPVPLNAVQHPVSVTELAYFSI